MQHSVYIFNDRIALCGTTHPHPEHRHAFVQIFISENQKKNVLDTRIIPSNCPHGLSSGGAHYFSLLLDPSSIHASRLRKTYIQNTEDHVIQLQLTGSSFPLHESIMSKDSDFIKNVSTRLLSLLSCQQLSTDIKKDSRILRVLTHIKQTGNLALSVTEAAGIAFLSESRFMSVFRQQTGLAFRNYLLMQKLVHGVHFLEKSGSFTEAAHAAGFADAAHFTRTFTRNTGMNLKDLFKNSRFIQVFYDLSI